MKPTENTELYYVLGLKDSKFACGFLFSDESENKTAQFIVSGAFDEVTHFEPAIETIRNLMGCGSE